MTEIQQAKVMELVESLCEFHAPHTVAHEEGDIWLSTDLNKGAKVYPDGSYILIWPRQYSEIPITHHP